MASSVAEGNTIMASDLLTAVLTLLDASSAERRAQPPAQAHAKPVDLHAARPNDHTPPVDSHTAFDTSHTAPDPSHTAPDPSHTAPDPSHTAAVEAHAAQGEAPPRARVAVVTGPIGAGKTTAVQALVRDLAERGIRVGGIVAPRVVREGETVGYDVVDLASHRTMVLARLSPPGQPVGRFYLTDEGLRVASDAILGGIGGAEVVCVDEVGHAELAGDGHARAVRLLLGAPVVAVLVVREHLVQEAVAAFGLAGAAIVHVAGANRPGP